MVQLLTVIKSRPICSLSAPETQLKQPLSTLVLWQRKREGGRYQERTEPGSIKTHKFRHWPVGLTAVSCPSLLHPRDGTVGKNKGTVTTNSRTPPTTPSYPIRKPAEGGIIPKGPFLHMQRDLFSLITCGTRPKLAGKHSETDFFLILKNYIC